MELEYQWQAVIFHRRLLRDNNTESDDDGSDESELDTNMVIILAFLLCTLILTLGLNAFARRGIFSSSAATATATATAAPGLKKCGLRHLPVAVHGSAPGKECSICLGDFEEGERIRVLPTCGHGFHVGCIDTWLISHASCPNCRISLLPLPP